MQEELIHFVWRNQLFNKLNLSTVSGQSLLILKQGLLNNDAGPDFSNGKTVMDELEWIGDIEIHYNSSQWNTHKHDQDVAYNQVILHVVWEHDKNVYRHDGSMLPTLELKDRVQPAILDQARILMKSTNHVPCQHFLPHIDKIHVSTVLNRALVQRLEQKSEKVFTELEQSSGNWEEAAFLLIAEALGSKVNGKALKELARRLPINILKKYAGNLFQIEALMFGISGLLRGKKASSQYLNELKQEFTFLAGKHGLSEKVMELSWWKFMRLRPSNFPTIRIAQLARLIAENSNLFSLFIHSDLNELNGKLKLVQSEYWQKHYTPGKRSKQPIPGLGQASINNIILNVTVPLLVGYGRELDELHYQDRAIEFLATLKPEDNRITKMWNSLGIKLINAAESQGSIELFNAECSYKKCLSCGIGYQILKSA